MTQVLANVRICPAGAVLRVLEACRGERTTGPLVLRPLSGKPVGRRDVYRMVKRFELNGTAARSRVTYPCSSPLLLVARPRVAVSSKLTTRVV